MLLLTNLAWAWECPEEPEIELTDYQIACEEDRFTVELSGTAGSSTLANAKVEVFDTSGDQVDTWYLDLDETDGNATTWRTGSPAPERSCEESWLLQASLYDEAGNSAQIEQWWNLPVDVENGGFEEGQDHWGSRGNVTVGGSRSGLDPASGNRMMALGWEAHAGSVYGYTWQVLGEVPAGTYRVDFQYAVATDPENVEEHICAGGQAPKFVIGMGVPGDGEGFDLDDYWLLEPNDFYCGLGSQESSTSAYIVPWTEYHVTLSVGELSDGVIFFNSYGGYAHQGHLLFLDEIRLVPLAD